MKRIIDILRTERLYLLLVIFIIVVNTIILLPRDGRHSSGNGPAPAGTAVSEKMPSKTETLARDRQAMAELLQKKPSLALVMGLVSLLIMTIIGLGVAVDAILVSNRLHGRRLDIATYPPHVVPWTIADVARAIILFLFFGYVLIIIESALAPYLPVIKDDNFRMVVNSSILDVLSVVFVFYFTVMQYREKLAALGLSLKNAARNIWYGIVGYIATIPLLILLLIIIAVILNAINYVPQKQPVVDLFLKEKNIPLVAYTGLFAAIVGPFIEELFFRGFMYTALKRSTGIVWATLITAAIFGVLHAHLVGFLPIMVLGILLAYLYEKTGTLVSSITVHMIHNLSMVFMVFLMKQVSG